ncbi:tRNA pseudouridine(38-40) synthase TruA [Haloglomus litoreum]|uniref:tRNA pseudouridine(38-40) synthase TruA n=1 Tax=Haloglomus litoreum TaxID=3034026 RepID=UPI0023E8A39D|nr:tRNA pseudouridine(38-40) synthase TruA [Haloglomus sp. DT116]
MSGDDLDGDAEAPGRSRRAFRVAYDGTGYRGFQRQPHGDTVEDALLDALCRLDVLDGDPGAEGDSRETPPGWAAAGRTDRGVSAVAQTVALDAPDWLTPRAFCGELPADVRVWASAEAPPGFHATHDARERRYEYHLHAPEADEDAVSRACARLSGAVDLHNLSADPRGEGTRRDLSLSAERDGAYLLLRARADGFPRECVRRLASLLAAVGSGERDLAFVERVLGDEPLPGPDGVAAAPPEPLVLVDVDYPGLDFTVDQRAAATAWTVFERRRVERTTGARVAEQLRRGASRDP